MIEILHPPVHLIDLSKARKVSRLGMKQDTDAEIKAEKSMRTLELSLKRALQRQRRLTIDIQRVSTESRRSLRSELEAIGIRIDQIKAKIVATHPSRNSSGLVE